MQPPLVLYTGTPAWVGPPEVRPVRKGRAEHGPGIYLTNRLETARKYAGGARTVLRVEVEPPSLWLEDAVVPTDVLVGWVMDRRGLRKKREIVDDLVTRGRGRLPSGQSYPFVLLNLLVNHGVVTGEHGPAIARFLSSLGISASHVERGGDEDWVVLFDPSKVRRWERVAAGAPWQLPRVRPRVT